ncbi:polyketide cyclase [Leptospira perolatii]|uniref:Polyketide cyclase n=1 Tax=Leptospira perolatii TaxID=2023191 RepID=A0A2M9ZP02_9LEPT|nr:polyketide cyclase [Leptospira perolatii]PJZ73812.1 polyketide cyclase [Leptospira perolatii]
MAKKITILVLAVLGISILVLLGLASTKPDTFHVQRTASIKAPAEKIFPLINDLHAMQTWSPFERDPAMKRTYSGPAAGKGSVYSWDGNEEVGMGRLEITEATPSSKIALKLDFLKPFEAHNFVEFTLEPKGDATNVTWAVHGPVPFVFKIFHVVCDPDTMMGADFEAGLASLKKQAEK